MSLLATHRAPTAGHRYQSQVSLPQRHDCSMHSGMGVTSLTLPRHNLTGKIDELNLAALATLTTLDLEGAGCCSSMCACDSCSGAQLEADLTLDL